MQVSVGHVKGLKARGGGGGGGEFIPGGREKYDAATQEKAD